MTTLAVMKSRIVDEIGGRTDLSSQIGSAITTAIEAYQATRFFFNESREVTFDTVAEQEFYDSADNSNIPNLYSIDYASVLIGSMTHPLRRATEPELEDVSNDATHKGEPFAYVYFAQKIRLYPIPTDVWEVRIAGQVKIVAPASDAEADNPWMTEAERLVRARAKAELALHVIRDPSMAAEMALAEQEALSWLKGRSNRQMATGRIRATSF